MNNDHYKLVSTYIQSKINDLDEFKAAENDMRKAIPSNSEDTPQEFKHFYVGAAQKEISIAKFKAKNSADPAYKMLRRQIVNFFNGAIENNVIVKQNGGRIQIHEEDLVRVSALPCNNYLLIFVDY